MPIKIPDNLPARSVLETEGVSVMSETDAVRQDIRPMRIGLLIGLGEQPRPLDVGREHDVDERAGSARRFLGNTGLAEGKLSQQLAASVYGLHFGDWGGLPVKLVYALLGSLLAVVIASGPRIWLARQRARGLSRPRWESAWSGVLWGAPLALAGSLLAAVDRTSVV